MCVIAACVHTQAVVICASVMSMRVPSCEASKQCIEQGRLLAGAPGRAVCKPSARYWWAARLCLRMQEMQEAEGRRLWTLVPEHLEQPLVGAAPAARKRAVPRRGLVRGCVEVPRPSRAALSPGPAGGPPGRSPAGAGTCDTGQGRQQSRRGQAHKQAAAQAQAVHTLPCLYSPKSHDYFAGWMA